MTYRMLRIAWSILCLIACVLLIQLRARSFHTRDVVSIPLLGLESMRGRLIVSPMSPALATTWQQTPLSRPNTAWIVWDQSFAWWKLANTKSGSLVMISPHRFVATACIALATVPWIHWPKQFTLRTLLAATTLVAVVLGTIVWAVSR